MGMSFAQPISADFTIREFALRQEGNADGWGLAWYPDQSLAMVKEPKSSGESHHMRFLESYHGLQSRIYLGHVRHGTRGGTPKHADTHPFHRELFGREYCFAHNGTVLFKPGELLLGRFHPVGDTDSEHVFCHLLDCMTHRELPLDSEDDWQWLYAKFSEFNQMGKFNCLMSDGDWLCAYHDINGWKGLSFRKVYVGDDEVRHFEDPAIGIDLETLSSADAVSREMNHGYVIATRPLSPTGWHSIKLGELLVIQNGVLCFSSHRAGRTAAP